MSAGSRARLTGIVVILCVAGLADLAVLNVVAIPGLRQSLAASETSAPVVTETASPVPLSAPQGGSEEPSKALALLSDDPPLGDRGETGLPVPAADEEPEPAGDEEPERAADEEPEPVAEEEPEPVADEAPAGAAAPPLAVGDLLFHSGSSDLTRQARHALWDVVFRMRSDASARVALRGHADSRGDESANEHLSQQRADSVAAFLAERGISRARIDTEAVGERDPADDSDTAAAYRRNRRVEVRWR